MDDGTTKISSPHDQRENLSRSTGKFNLKKCFIWVRIFVFSDEASYMHGQHRGDFLIVAKA
ncbi:MAG: hypothetical protein MJE68_18225 [Proteobacteria bacterium]|nr:hypothetical protein [Pseudomonadota bacterium]